MDYCSGSGLGNSGCPPGAYRAYVAIQGPMGDTGPTGPQGEKGETGEAGAQGIQGPRGETGPTGPQGEKGETGEAGVQGIQDPTGEAGEQGQQGETPTVTVAEDTPVSYKLNFKTSDQDMTTPNLLAPFTEYHVDLFRCARYETYVCGGPVYGLSDVTALSAGMGGRRGSGLRHGLGARRLRREARPAGERLSFRRPARRHDRGIRRGQRRLAVQPFVQRN